MTREGKNARVCPGIQRKVCSEEDWEADFACAPEPPPRAVRATTAAATVSSAASAPKRYELPEGVDTAIKKSIGETFQDGLFVDGGNLRSGQLRQGDAEAE